MRFNELYNNIISRNLLTEERLPGVKDVIIYPGRFQPMLPHHAKVYKRLQDNNPDSEVYIGTSDKVEPQESPFDFEEKRKIITQLYNIPEDRVLMVTRPYNGDEYAQFFEPNKTVLSLAVGAKDMEESPRFAFNNPDPITGLEMKKRGTGPTFIQHQSALANDPKTLDKHAYIITAPTVTSQGKIASASAFRSDLRQSNDPEKMLHDLFGDKVNPVKDLIINKITEE